MSTHYLVDAHTTPITASQINEVRLAGVTTANGFLANASIMTGNFVVRVPDGVSVQNPTDYEDLIDKKYAGLLANYPAFTEVVWDDFRDDTGLEVLSAAGGLLRGSRGTCMLSDTALVRTVTVDVSPAVVTQLVAFWEFYEVQYINPMDGPAQRIYVERAPTDMNVSVSTNNGSNTTSVAYGVQVEIPALEAGSDIKMVFTGTGTDTGHRLFLGSWAVIY